MLPTCDDLQQHPLDYLYLRRKRQFTMDDTKVVYGEGEQTHYTVLFSPNKLEDQYPLYDLELRTRSMKPNITEYKNEYFLMSDPDVQKHITDDTAKKIVDLLMIFIEFEDWKEPDPVY